MEASPIEFNLSAADLAILDHGWFYVYGVPVAVAEMLSLEDENGNAAEGAIKPAGNHMTPPPFWRQLPSETLIRFTISSGAYEYFPDGRVWLRPLPFHAWLMTENRGRRLIFAGSLSQASPWRGGPWKVPLALPRVLLQ